MDATNILVTIGTSATISVLVTFLLKTYFKARIEAAFATELEKYKSQMQLQVHQGQEQISRRS